MVYFVCLESGFLCYPCSYSTYIGVLEFLGTKIDRLYMLDYLRTKIEHLDCTYVFGIKIERLYTINMIRVFCKEDIGL
jgi:hypothetical protein